MTKQSRTDFEFQLIHNKNTSFITGKSNYIISSSELQLFIGLLAMVIIFGFLSIRIMLGILSRGSFTLAGPGAISLLFGVIAIVLAIMIFINGRALLADYLLTRQGGQLVQGRATHAKLIRGARGASLLEVHYQFQIPQGKLVSGKTTFNFGLGERPQIIPTKDTSLAILWIDEKRHKAL